MLRDGKKAISDLRKLAKLTNKIRNVVKGCGGDTVVRYDIQRDKLIVWRRGGRICCQATCIPSGMT
jgi:hypothetical protein